MSAFVKMFRCFGVIVFLRPAGDENKNNYINYIYNILKRQQNNDGQKTKSERRRAERFRTEKISPAPFPELLKNRIFETVACTRARLRLGRRSE